MTLLEQARQEDLERAYMAFTNSARSLERAYGDLARKAERLDFELHEANERLRTVLSALPAGVVAAGFDGSVSTINETACQILGLPSRPVGGTLHIRDFFDLSGQPLLLPSQGAEDRVLPGGDGSGPRRVRVRSLLLPAEGGALWILEDRTEQERLEGEVARLDRLAGLGRLALSIAHEIRNPLNAVAGFAGLLVRRLTGDKERHYANRIIEGVRRVDAIIQNLLAFARPAGQTFGPLDLAAVVRTTLLEWQGGALSVRIPEGPVWVRGDATAMRRVLENLLQNAVDAGGIGVPIEIVLEGRAGSVLLAVEDGGPGITPDRRQEVFEPFRSGREQGTGLGLAIVQSLVEAQGGRVRAVEPGSCCGARLEVLLPAGGPS